MDIAKGMDAIIGRMNVESLIGIMNYRVARTREELLSSYKLVYKEYLKRGYVCENESEIRLSIYNAIPETTTFVGVVEGNVLATATIIPDSPLGLPMDAIYKEELDKFRDEQKTICEISMLASDTSLFKGGTSIMLNAKKMFFVFFLFKNIFDYVQEVLKLDYICITINPKHSITYDFLMFKNIGGLKYYQSANQAPAIAKSLDVNNAEAECRETKKGLYKMFFSNKTDPGAFSDKMRLSQDDLKYFFVDKTDIFKNISDEQLTYIKSCYSACDFSKILK